MDKEIDHEYTDEIVCPYCGYEHGDSWEEKNEDGEMKCDGCGKIFEWQRDTRITYVTEKDCAKNNEEHKFSDNPYIWKHDDGKEYAICKKCNTYVERQKSKTGGE